MDADIVGALEQLDRSWKAFEHKGKQMTKQQVREVLVYGIKKGYKTTNQLSEQEVDTLLGLEEGDKCTTDQQTEIGFFQTKKEVDVFAAASQVGSYLAGVKRPAFRLVKLCEEPKLVPLSPKYRVGRKQKRAILETATGLEYLVFPKGKEEAAEKFCNWLNSQQR